jgi:plastocyanin
MTASAWSNRFVRCVAVLATLAATASATRAQSALERPPNMHGAWSGRSGTVYFHFLHRFMSTGAPVRKVVNYPTFLLGVATPANFLVGARYSTNSELVAQVPNEWELFVRNSPLRESAGDPVSLSLHGAWNHASRSWDAEVEVARALGPVRVLVAGRRFSNPLDAGEARYAIAGGAAIRLHEFVSLAGDYARLTDLYTDTLGAAWSVGLQLAIPYTPHTLSIQLSNTSTTTLEGASLAIKRPVEGRAGELEAERRWGFEFTVPFTLSRYFGGRSASVPAQSGAGGGAAVEVGMTNQLRFTADTVRVRVGQTVRWRNTSDVLHTVTADPSRAANRSNVQLPGGASTFDSGDMAPGAVFEYTFTIAGEYGYVCVPHELAGMVGTIIVEEQE